MFGQGFAVVDGNLTMFGLTAALFFFLLHFATAATLLLLLQIQGKILQDLTAEMVRQCGAAYIGGQQYDQYEGNKLFQNRDKAVARYNLI